MANREPGYVYILTNPSFREDWVKIGKSSRPVDVRSKELDNTAVPLPFEIYATLRTKKYNEAEKLVHRYIERFTDRRIRSTREFFNVKPEEALEILRDVALVIDDAFIEEVHKAEILGSYEQRKKQSNSKTPFRKEPWVWMVPSNQKYFDLATCIEKYGEIYWSQYVKFQTGDTGYIYSAYPDSAIRYSFEVIGHDLIYTSEMEREDEFWASHSDREESKTHNRFALFRITGRTSSQRLGLANLMDRGLKMSPRGSLKLSNADYLELLEYIKKNF